MSTEAFTLITTTNLEYGRKPVPWVLRVSVRSQDGVWLSGTRTEYFYWRWTARLAARRIGRSMRRELANKIAGKYQNIGETKKSHVTISSA